MITGVLNEEKSMKPQKYLFEFWPDPTVVNIHTTVKLNDPDLQEMLTDLLRYNNVGAEPDVQFETYSAQLKIGLAFDRNEVAANVWELWRPVISKECGVDDVNGWSKKLDIITRPENIQFNPITQLPYFSNNNPDR